MPESAVTRLFGQLAWSLRQRGPLYTLRVIAERLGGRRREPLPPHPFDVEHGTNTSGLIGSRDLRSGHAHDVHSTAYFGTPPSRLRHAIARWQVETGTADLGKYTFFDVGCGKGRALLVASVMGFGQVAGVELNAALADTARANLDLWRRTHPDAAPASILTGNATTAPLPPGSLLLYLYNPFAAPVLRELLRRIVENSVAREAPLYVLYLYPEHAKVFLEFSRCGEVWCGTIPLEHGEALDGVSSFEDPCCVYRLSPPSA